MRLNNVSEYIATLDRLIRSGMDYITASAFARAIDSLDVEITLMILLRAAICKIYISGEMSKSDTLSLLRYGIDPRPELLYSPQNINASGNIIASVALPAIYEAIMHKASILDNRTLIGRVDAVANAVNDVIYQLITSILKHIKRGTMQEHIVIIPIRPKWLELIMDGKKTVEIRSRVVNRGVSRILFYESGTGLITASAHIDRQYYATADEIIETSLISKACMVPSELISYAKCERNMDTKKIACIHVSEPYKLRIPIPLEEVSLMRAPQFYVYRYIALERLRRAK